MGTFVGDPSKEKFLFRKVNGVPPSLIVHESSWCQVSHVIGVNVSHLWPCTVTALQNCCGCCGRSGTQAPCGSVVGAALACLHASPPLVGLLCAPGNCKTISPLASSGTLPNPGLSSSFRNGASLSSV